MKSMLSLTAAAVLCASTSFAQEAPAQTDVIQGQAGATTVDGQAAGLAALGGGLGAAGVVGFVAVVAAAAAISNSDSSNGTN